LRTRQAERGDRTQHAKREAGAVDRDHHGRTVGRDVGNGFTQAPTQGDDIGKDLEQAHQRQFAHRKPADQAVFRHALAADAGKAKARATGQQRGHQTPAQHVAAGLAGDQVDQREIHGRGA
jgi:hypothetical protein